MVPTIRLAVPKDGEAITAIYTPIVEDTHISFETKPPTNNEMARRIQNTIEQLPWLVCEYDGDVTGYAYASPQSSRSAYQWGVDTSVYVDERWQKQGVARGLYVSLFELLRRQGFYTAYAVIALPNPASIEFHESFGFEQVGGYERVGFKNGYWHDVGHWEITIQPHETPPSPPTSLDEFCDSDMATALATGEPSLRLG